MSDSAAKTLPKPKLRGLLQSNLRTHAIFATVFCTACVFGWKFLVVDPRKRKYAEFYKNYDAEKDFQRMVKAGVFDSVKPDGK